jgi:hypothetical protein
MSGLSPGNLNYMRRFAAAWPDRDSCPQLVGKMPWGHNRVLLDRLDDRELRACYAQAIEFGWSRAVLEPQIMSGLHRRAGAAPSNFARLLPAGDLELVQQITKDPYNLEFLTLERDAAERTLEAALVTHGFALLDVNTGSMLMVTSCSSICSCFISRRLVMS